MTNPQEEAFRATIDNYDEVADRYVARHKANKRWDGKFDPFIQFTERLPENALVLDLGCGPGHDTHRFRQNGFRAIGFDLSKGMLEQARLYNTDLAFAQVDMRRLPLPDHCLDAIWMSASMLHIPRSDAPRTLAEVSRVLQTDAWMFLSLKLGEDEIVTHNMGRRTFTLYGEGELEGLLTDAGFRVQERTIVDDYVLWISLIVQKI